jgi:hypothetical protein
MGRSAVTLSILLLVAVAVPAFGADSAQVDQALVKAKQYVYSQHQDGSWEKEPKQDLKAQDKIVASQWGGQTALAVYALLAGGENPNAEPRLAAGIDFLKKAKIGGTYALGLRCMVWLLLPETAEVKGLMRRDAQALQAMMKSQGNAKGFYDYDARGNSYSLSRAQYAVLGMWAAAQSGVEVPADYWRRVEAAWAGAQESDGGWQYQKGGRGYPTTAGMTAAGVATLLVAQEHLLAVSAGHCEGNPLHPAIDRGLAWLEQNFGQVASGQDYERDYPYATLYAVERVGVNSGLKYFGRNDWYQKGSDYLIKSQYKDGSWKAASSYFGALPDTCFGILFLARGRSPLLMNKLQHGAQIEATAAAPGAAAQKPDALTAVKKLQEKPADWNQRPRDVANLSNWVSTVAERELNWQVLGPAATIRDFHDAPVLYVSGSQPLALGEDTKDKLRAYVEGGGLVLGHADCAGRAFAASFRKLGAELFPRYEFRELPADHVIYNGVFPREKWKNKPSVLGLSNGVRELMLLLPQSDPGRAWQSKMVGGREEHWQLGADIFFYAAERRNLRYRGESHLVTADPKVETSRDVPVARLEYAGNWNPEPGGWRRLANVLHNEQRVKLAVREVKLGEGKLGSDVRLAHLTGTSAFKLTGAQRNELRKFVEAGGSLLIDAAGGSAAFADAADAEVHALFPNAKPAVLPLSHPLYSSGKSKLLNVTYRAFAQKAVAGSTRVPRLQAVTVGGRAAVFVSREDLSTGIVGHPVDGVIGYDPRSATDIVSRVVLYAAGPASDNKPVDPKPPADKKPAKPDLPF